MSVPSRPRIHPHELVEDHLNLANSIAHKIWRKAPSVLEREEMVGLANYGLVMAADRYADYCEERGFDIANVSYFIPFAMQRIQGAIFDRLRQTDHATRSVRTKAKKLAAAGSGQGATEEELMARTGLTAKEIRDTRAELDRKPVGIEAAERVPVLRDVETLTEESAVLHSMADMIQTLSDIEQVILALHYYEEMELQQIALLLNITESRASHFHTAAVLRVRDALQFAVVSTDIPTLLQSA